MTEVTNEDKKIAHRLSRRYNGNKRFSHEDAFQAAMEGLIRSGYPKDEGLRVLAMKNGIARQVTMAVFPVCITRSTYDRMKKDGRLAALVGGKDVRVNDLVFERPEIEDGFSAVEDSELVRKILSSLSDAERRVINIFMRGKQFAYKTREMDRLLLAATLDKIKAEMEET